MEPTNTTTVPNRSRSMILQPDDIVALTAEKAIAHIEEAMRALAREDPGDAGRQPVPAVNTAPCMHAGNTDSREPSTGRRRLSNVGAEPETNHEGGMRTGDNGDIRTGGTAA